MPDDVCVPCTCNTNAFRAPWHAKAYHNYHILWDAGGSVPDGMLRPNFIQANKTRDVQEREFARLDDDVVYSDDDIITGAPTPARPVRIARQRARFLRRNYRPSFREAQERNLRIQAAVRRSIRRSSQGRYGLPRT